MGWKKDTLGPYLNEGEILEYLKGFPKGLHCRDIAKHFGVLDLKRIAGPLTNLKCKGLVNGGKKGIWVPWVDKGYLLKSSRAHTTQPWEDTSPNPDLPQVQLEIQQETQETTMN